MFEKIVTKTNNFLAILSGIFVFIIGLLTVFESVMRSFLRKPTLWTSDVCSYLLIWVFFLGFSYSFQSKGQVSVDLLRDIVESRWGKKPRRVMAVIGWIMSLVTVFILLRAGFLVCRNALRYNQLTPNLNQIPSVYLHSAIVVGSILTLITIVFIVIKVIKGDDTYI